ncbi:MAG TPA: radical SAM family heme chaperone HemW [Candidatus Limnocylindria bacterium]|nr:radical SAM family heme chaperone HemW [Candidatus Limnocylindria bacterium]
MGGQDVAAPPDAWLPAGSHHLYVHVPFCRLVCAYCDFVTVGGRRADIPRYVAALLAELALRPAPGTLATIYFGGGTPSLLPAAAVARLVDAARSRWGGRTALTEVSLEANPSARERPDWSGLRRAGVTRVSLGAQSLRDAELRTLARGHTAAEVRETYRAARLAGFDSVSLDLIYAVPGQSLDDWRIGLAAAIALAPDHVSLYALQLALSPDDWAAPPRRGALRWRRRLARRQDDALAADQYRLAEEMLAAAGYRHYELSSWARRGHEARHNAAYWLRRPYTGIGAGAHSYDGHSCRSWNARDLDEYLERTAAGERALGGSERLDDAEREFEAVALGLRLIDGLDRRRFAAEFGDDLLARYGVAVAEGGAKGLLDLDAGRMRLSRRGRLLANEALAAFAPD